MRALSDPPLHSWDLDAAQARALQAELAARVDTSRRLRPYETVAGADVSYNKWSPTLHAAVVVLRAGTLEPIERAGVVAEARFPYVPGLLSFREAPAVIAAFGKLTVRPDVLICDGQGIAHPRRLGLACHLGLWLGIPTIGCAKSWLFGQYQEPGSERGDWTPLTDGDETIGAVLRSRSRVQPLFVSPGHLCDLDGAIAAVLASTSKFRLPETTRLAHNYVNELRRGAGE
ncbi:MAG TPA: deoxyribonuclease V [Isosphaeraceae bacterium]|nr:deoxyribonuclease V [Isosphaeraceae bacterium]